jgi:catalase
MTAGNRGPVLMQDVHLLEKLSHFDCNASPSALYTPKEREQVAILKSLLM